MTAGGFLQNLRNELRLRGLQRFLGSDGAVLDYGCGAGSFLVYAASRLPGRRFFGFEIADRPETIDLADGVVTIVKGDPADLIRVLPHCRLVSMNHVIEHIADPQAVITALHDRLLPGGTLQGQTPAADSFEHRVFGTKWSGYHAPRHTVVFSRSGLRRLLDRCGFAEVDVSPGFNPAGVAVSLASLPHGDAGGSVPRNGVRWLAALAAATVLAPIDLLSGAPGMMNFVARKPER